MKKRQFLLALLPLLTLISCAQKSGQVTLKFIAEGIECQNAKEIYNVGETVRLSLTVDELLYRYPVPGEVQVYGSENYHYDEAAHEIKITFDKDTTICIASTAKYGKKVDLLHVARALDERIASSPEATLSITTLSLKYYMHTTSDSIFAPYFNEMLEALFQIKIEDELPLDGEIEIPCALTFLPEDRSHYESLLMDIFITGGYNNRISFTKDDCGYFTNEEAAINIHSCEAIQTKDFSLSGGFVCHFNKNAFLDSLYFCLDSESSYKSINFCIGDYFYLEVK